MVDVIGYYKSLDFVEVLVVIGIVNFLVRVVCYLFRSVGRERSGLVNLVVV